MCNPSLMLCEPPPTLPEVAMDASPFDAPALSPGNAAAQGAAATMPAPLDTSLAADGSVHRMAQEVVHLLPRTQRALDERKRHPNPSKRS